MKTVTAWTIVVACVGSPQVSLAGWLSDLLPKVPQPTQPIAAPLLKPFANNRDWVLAKDLLYRIGDTNVTIHVPQGFVTDFASIPQAFWSFGLSPNGDYSKAAIVHDYLYWSQGCTRLQADNILLIAMKESNVATATRDTIYQGVRVGGTSAWSKNASDRARGLPRVVPESAMEFGPFVLWADYQTELARRGVADPAFPTSPTYCLLGDSTDVPGATPTRP